MSAATKFRSKVYTDRPAYADFSAPAKYDAIRSIIAKRLKERPNAICSYRYLRGAWNSTQTTQKTNTRMKIAAPNTEAVETASYLYADGAEGIHDANNGYTGLRPALLLKSGISVSDEPDERGVYILG
jgi:hypothetical protein